METGISVYIPRASAAWKLIMQSGVGLAVTVGVTLADFFTTELGLTEREQQAIEALVLDGMPVDDPATAIVEDNARLALAAGLPGIAGLSMKKNSAVRALRGGITYRSHEAPRPRNGRVTLALYSLVLPALGGHFLKRGLLITPAQFRRYAPFAPDDLCQVDGGRTLSAAELAEELVVAPEGVEMLFTAVIPEGPNA